MLSAKKGVGCVLVGVLSLGAGGCNGLSGPPDLGPEDRGTLVLDRADTGFSPDEKVWTRDGSDLVFISNGLKAVNVGSHQVRVLDAAQGISDVARGVGSEWVYYTAAVPNGNGSEMQLKRVLPSTGAVENIALISVAGGSGLAVSSDEHWVAVGGLLIDRQAGTSKSLPNGHAIGFSPDGTRLLYNSFGSTPLSVISTADLSSQPVVPLQSFVSAVRWSANSPQILAVRSDPPAPGHALVAQVLEVDGLSGTEHKLAEFDNYPSPQYAAWSDDGQTLGIWIRTSPIPEINELALIRPGSPVSMTLRVNAFVGTPVFSPAGTAVIYPVFTSTGGFSGLTTFYHKTGI